MFKTLLRSIWRLLKNLGTASPSSTTKRKGNFRSGFQRLLWAGILLFFYFGMHYYSMMNSEVVSDGNSDIVNLLTGALFVGALGAFLAPRFSEYLAGWTSSGRRKKLQKLQRNSYKKQAESKKNEPSK